MSGYACRLPVLHGMSQEFAGREGGDGTGARVRQDLFQKEQCLSQYFYRCRDGQRAGMRLFREFAAVGMQGQWKVTVCHGRQAEFLLQYDLPRRVVEQVGAAHDMRDALCGVIHDNGELVGEKSVAAAQDEVADAFLHVFLLLAKDSVMEVRDAGGHAQADGGVIAR